MTNPNVCCIRRSAAISHAYEILSAQGISVSAYPTRNTKYLLLPVPSFPNGSAYLEELLPQLSWDVVICGGNLNIPVLNDYRTIDFLADPFYLAENAAITARCAIRILSDRIRVNSTSVLILGWGRIGKCLGKFLNELGARVSIAARKPEDLAVIHALGYTAVPVNSVHRILPQYQAILNTIPAMILPQMETQDDAVILELASTPGMAGKNIIPTRGLPGIMAPEESGKLIAETFMRFFSNLEGNL